ncbi:class I SAM-dependent methyltransferase [Roseiflexus sp.]|uniref:class I SAM-dependent methyltransferase n=1 Tax=Roseiflexus sp. TaxID=2562120 RepID=UPI00398A9B99
MIALGLREHHTLLDIGCGSLRGGKLFIPYLLPGHYYGIEPERWLVKEGISRELGQDLVRLKRPEFSHDSSFTLSTFGRQFDFILAQSIFSHTSKAQIHRCLEEADKVMSPSSLFIANYAIGEQDYEGDDWVYPGGVTFTPTSMSRFGAEHGLTMMPIYWPHPHGLSWFVFVRPGNESAADALAQQPVQLQQALAMCQKRLAEIEGHPYVKLGMWIRQTLRRRLTRSDGVVPPPSNVG